MSRSCELCRLDPAIGNSSITDDNGVLHPLCHPLTGTGPRSLSCFEIVGFALVENLPQGRRPQQEIPPVLRERAREFIAAYGPRNL